MSTTTKLRAGDRALLEQIAAVTVLCDRDSCPDPDQPLMAMRWAVARTLVEHIAFEETHLLAPMEASEDVTMKVRAAAIIAGQATFKDEMIAHVFRWPAEQVHKDWPGFRRAMAEAHRLITERIAWERRVLIPAIKELNGRTGTPKRNWARDVWAVKDALTGC